MTKRRLGPLLIAAALAIGAGCERHIAQAANPVTPAPGAPAAPAPFATPPVLPGTPDVATLVAKVTPAVVNITTIHDIRQQQIPESEFPFGFDPFEMFPGIRRGPGAGYGNRKVKVILQRGHR